MVPGARVKSVCHCTWLFLCLILVLQKSQLLITWLSWGLYTTPTMFPADSKSCCPSHGVGWSPSGIRSKYFCLSFQDNKKLVRGSMEKGRSKLHRVRPSWLSELCASVLGCLCCHCTDSADGLGVLSVQALLGPLLAQCG